MEQDGGTGEEVTSLDKLKQVLSQFSESGKSKQGKGYEVLKNRLRGLHTDDAKEDLNTVLSHLWISELRVFPEEHRVLLTEFILVEERAREAMTRQLFEEHCFTAVMFVPQEFLACVGAGRETGLVVNLGDSYTSIVPIWKCNILRHCTTILPFGGRDVTAVLKLLLERRHGHEVYHTFTTPTILENIKVKHGYVAENYNLELLKKPTKHVKYELPDCQTINLGRELFQAPELLFSPQLLGIEDSPGLTDGIVAVIVSLSPKIRTDILDEGAGIILCGSSSMFPGLVSRLEADLGPALRTAGILPSRPKLRAPPERKLIAWIGGSIWASLSSTRSDWTTLEEYTKFGAGVVHARCM